MDITGASIMNGGHIITSMLQILLWSVSVPSSLPVSTTRDATATMMTQTGSKIAYFLKIRNSSL